MNNNLDSLSIDELRELLQASRQTLISLVDSLAHRPDMQNAIRRLMRPLPLRPPRSQSLIGSAWPPQPQNFHHGR